MPPAPPPGLQASSSGWGGLDAGDQMLYPAQVVDGLVHTYAGASLRTALAALPVRSDGKRCELGEAVISPSFGLHEQFDVIAHTPTPFWPANDGDDGIDEWREQLHSCYVAAITALVKPNVLAEAEPHGDTALAVASPLLGVGAAGAPVGLGAEVAVDARASLSARGLARPIDVWLVLNEHSAVEAVETALTAEENCRGRLSRASEN